MSLLKLKLKPQGIRIPLKPPKIKLQLKPNTNQVVIDQVLNHLKSICLENESWKVVVGQTNYFISTHGRVWSNLSGRLLSTYLNTMYEYLLCKIGQESCLVHELVAFAFIGLIPVGYVIDHFDQNKLNNCISNLRYVTPSENAINSTPKIGASLAINQYELDGTYLRTWKSIQSAIVALNNYSNVFIYYGIYNACMTDEQTYNGFQWKLFDQSLPIEGEIWKPFNLNDLTRYLSLNTNTNTNTNNGNIDCDQDIDIDVSTELKMYQASNMGRIQKPKGIRTYGHIGGSNYAHIDINGRTIQVGRIICEVFNGSPPSQDCVSDHINDDRSDNRAENLQWLTVADNLRKSVCKAVEYVNLEEDTVISYPSVKEASKATSQSANTIATKCQGIVKQNSSHFWRYKVAYSNYDKGARTPTATARAVNKFALNGTFIATFPSIAEAVRNYHQNQDQVISPKAIKTGRVVECCKGQKDSVGGFRWQYVNQRVKFTTVDPSKRVQQYSTEGVHIKDFDDASQAATELMIPSGEITLCCKLQNRSARGFIFKYGTDVRPVIPLSVTIHYSQYQADDTLIKRYTSLGVAAKDVKIEKRTINKYSLGNKKTLDGTIWKREIPDATTGNYIVV
jgi:hypothetical protein